MAGGRADGDTLYFEMSAAQKMVDADDQARRKLAVEIVSISGVEYIIETEISAIHLHRDEVVHR